MPLLTLDERLLSEAYDASMTLDTLSLLSPAQLAIAASRGDLAVLIRQRAFHAFLSQRAAFREAKTEADALTEIFTVPTCPVSPSDIDKASPATLLLIRFDSECHDEDIIDAAASRFRQLASDWHNRSSPHAAGAVAEETATAPQRSNHEPLVLAISKASLECPSRDPLSAEDLELRVGNGKLSIYRLDNVLGSVRATHISHVSYIAGEDDEQDRVDYSLRIEATMIKLPDGQTVGPRCRLDLALGMLHNADLAFIHLRKTIASWQGQLGFRNSAKADPLPHTPPVPPPTADASTADASSLADNLARPPATSTTLQSFQQTAPHVQKHLFPALASSSVGSHTADEPGDHTERTKDQRLDTHQRLPSGPYRYLGRKPADVEWTAGYWARLYALLQAIGPRVVFNFPQFTREEIFILSFLSNPSSLPTLPKDPLPTQAKHAPLVRLGLEHIYHRLEYLSVAQARQVLVTSKYPELLSYARIVGKTIDARDAFILACDFLIENELKMRLGDKTTRDPVRQLILLVQSLRDDPKLQVLRVAYFSRSDYRLINTSKFTDSLIGKGPSRRFRQQLEDIVEYERDVLSDETFWKRMP
ncbi:hypothetical protein JCM10908_003433 [Rhodotorula pacifica]|uniref:uncharacterized protein n=1 Tax=Rhodotorula pacifica TaxID=1495444 RepID=UPI0031805FEE